MDKSQSQSSASSTRSEPPGRRQRQRQRASTLFPLPDDFFGQAPLTREQEQELEALVNQRLAAALADERAIKLREAQHLPRLDPRDWKFVSTHQQLQIYRSRRRRGSASSSSNSSSNKGGQTADNVRVSEDQGGQPSVIGFGRVEATVEDVIYGLFDTNRAEMLTSVSFLDNTTWDGTVLHCVQAGVPEDPFRLLAVKWLLSRFASSVFIAPRDWCYAVAAGIRLDDQGQRYGYVVTHSIPLATCPPFHKETGVVRGKMFFHFLFRESTPGFVEVYSRCIFDPAGDLIRAFVNIASAKLVSGFFRTVECAEAKKLTILARRHAMQRNGKPELEDFCSMCIKRGSMFSTVRLKLCGVCGVTVCTKCAVKKRLFSLSTKVIRACSSCVLAAKRLTGIRPADPEFALLQEPSTPSKVHASIELGGSASIAVLDEESSSHSSGPSGSSSSKSHVAPTFDNLGRMLLNKKADQADHTHSYQSDLATTKMESSSSFDRFYPDSLSDLDSEEYNFSDGEGKEKEDPEEELLRLLKSQSLSSSVGPPSTQQTGEDSSWQPSPNDQESASASPAAPADRTHSVHENNLYLRMLEIQNTAQQVYELTQANERIIRHLQ